MIVPIFSFSTQFLNSLGIIFTDGKNNNNNNSNNNSLIPTAPYGLYFRGDGHRSDQCSENDWLNKYVLSLNLTRSSAVAEGPCDVHGL